MTGDEGNAEMMARELEALLARLPGAAALERRSDGIWMEVPGLDVISMAEAMAELGARLITMTGLPLPEGEAAVIYHYSVGSMTIHVRSRSQQRVLPSIAPVTRAAAWIEREIADLYGVSFAGHPDPRRLVRPPALAAGFFRSSRDPAGGNDRQAVNPPQPPATA